MSLYLLFGQYSEWTDFEPTSSGQGQASSSSGAQPTEHWDWGPVASAAPELHWDAWGFPVVAAAPEQPASAWSAEALPHQAVPLVPKAASMLVAPNTPPADAEAEAQDKVAEWAQGNLAKLAQGLQGGRAELKAAKQVAEWAQGKVAELEAKPGPKPPSTDPLQYFAQAQAHVPLVIDR